ncbi:MAG: hypothetical protein ACTSRK_16970, partial [Promethearchaeota archaeon]
MNFKKLPLFVKIINFLLYLYSLMILLILILQFDHIMGLFSIIGMYQTLERFFLLLTIEISTLLIVNVFFYILLGNSIRIRSQTGRAVLIFNSFASIFLSLLQIIFRFSILSNRFPDFLRYSSVFLIINWVLLFFYGIVFISYNLSKSIKKLFSEEEKIKIKSEKTQIIHKNSLK